METRGALMREGAADGKGNNYANIIKKSGLTKRKHVFLCRPVFSSLSVATGWGMRYGAEEACPMCIWGFLGRLDGGVCHSRQGKESYTQEGAERGTNDPKYELWHQETTCRQCFMGIGKSRP